MAMNVGGGAGVRSEINVTPLVDVVLVLLIIFMVITPLLQRGYEVKTPPKLETAVPLPTPEDQLIVRVERDGRTYINKTMVPTERFRVELARVLQGRAEKIVFFAADGDLPYDQVMSFMDQCRDAGAVNLGIVFDDLRPVGG